MVFCSVEFIFIFLPVLLIAYYIIPVSYRNYVLLLGSLFFYAYGEPAYIVLLLASVFLNYVLAKGMDKERIETKLWQRKLSFAFGVAVNLALLTTFKLAPAQLGLPLGISFYTFQSISYLADVYKKEIPAETSIAKMGTYICMFPQLVAGPIVAYSEVKQHLDYPIVTKYDFDSGLKDFTVGLAMKILLADRLAILFKEVAGVGYESVATPLLWMTSISYSLQIYFDFFGYSMMAIGLGKMLGFHLPKNFDLPYISLSVREFYRRWHMTLGRFFSKYVYIPCGGSRSGIKKTLRNLFIVWILTALWHGVSINFILWGMLLCAVIMIEKLCAMKWPQASNRYRILRHAYVLLVIVISWTIFAISDISQLVVYLGRMFGIVKGINVNADFFALEFEKFGPTILIGILLCTSPAHELYKKCKDHIAGMVVLTALFWVSIWYILVMGNNPFMYFRF